MAQWTDPQGVFHNTDDLPYGDQGDTRYQQGGSLYNPGTPPPGAGGGGGGGMPPAAAGGTPQPGAGGGNWDQYIQYLISGAQQKWELEKAKAEQEMQLAKTADERAAAYLKIAEANQQLAQLKNTQDYTLGRANISAGLLSTAAQLQGPRNYAKFMQYTSGGRDLMSQLYGNEPRAAFSAPTGQLEPQNLQSLMQSLGLGGGIPGIGAGQAARQPGGADNQAYATGLYQQPGQQGGAANRAFVLPGGAGNQMAAGQAGTGNEAMQGRNVPLPHQVNPGVWNSLGNVGQQMTLGLAESQGWDADEYMRQMNAARPTGRVGGRTSYGFKSPTSTF